MNDEGFEKIHKIGHIQPVSLLGRDEQGQMRCLCPDCGDDEAYFDADGQGHCPTDERVTVFLREALTAVGLLSPQEQL